MKLRVVLPAIGFIVLGLTAAAVAAWATRDHTEKVIPIDSEVFITDRDGPRAFSYFLNLTPPDRDQKVTVYFRFNESVFHDDPGTGGTIITTTLYADDVEAQGTRDHFERPQEQYLRSILRTEKLPVEGGHSLRLRVDVTSEPYPGPQADWAIRHHAMDWRVETETGSLWPAVFALGGLGAGSAAAWVLGARRRAAVPEAA